MGHTGRTTILNLPYFDDDDVSSGDDFGAEAQGIDNQLVNLATAWGEGVIGDSSWEVAAGTGLSVSVAAGRGILDAFAGLTSESTTVTGLTDNTDNYIWARPHNGGTEIDQAWTLVPTFEPQLVSTGVTGLCLAKVTCASGAITAVEDLRTFVGQAYLQGQITAVVADCAWIAAALGADYADYGGTTPATVDARLDALETAVGEIGGSEVVEVFWALLKRSNADTRTIEEFLEDWWEAKEQSSQGGWVFSDWDSTTCIALVETMRQTRLYGSEAWSQQWNVFVFDAAMSPDAHYDTVNSTATVDRELGVIR